MKSLKAQSPKWKTHLNVSIRVFLLCKYRKPEFTIRFTPTQIKAENKTENSERNTKSCLAEYITEHSFKALCHEADEESWILFSHHQV
jgi:hypothetical protein